MGVWQVERLDWKRELIRSVEARLAAPAVSPPDAADGSASLAYTRVAVTGTFLHDRETTVQAVTDLGPGWWVITPLRTDGGTVLINRGFVPSERRDAASRPENPAHARTTVTGLLRAAEPEGGFLRSNAPDEDRWYSRDVEAIARARGLEGAVAPFFIDADATPNPGGYPVGGLTVVRFSDNHLVYALTWFGLCGLSLFGAAIVWRRGRRA